MRIPYISLPVRLSILFVVAVILADVAIGAEFERTFNFDSKELKVENMIGKVEVVASRDDQFKVTIKVQGQDASEDLLQFNLDEGSKGHLVVAFPIDDHRKYVYPKLGKGSKTTMHYRHGDGEDESWLKKVFSGMSGKRITVRGKGSGLEMWADLVIEVPRGRILHMEQGVGAIHAERLEGDLSLDTSTGTIEVQDIEGDVVADTGSGRVVVASVTGDVFVDTGSGHVRVGNVEGDRVEVDTGSGSVEVVGIRCAGLNIDTGSGRVKAVAVSTDKATIDTGSGSVLLQLDRMGTGKFHVDTGSGSITLALPDNASAHIQAETGSGGIDNELRGAMVRTKARDELDMTVGDGEARVVLDAGSGSITIK